jgi:hypothetical protein
MMNGTPASAATCPKSSWPSYQATRKLGGSSHTRTAQGIVSNSLLTANPVEIIQATPCDLSGGRYDHTTRLGKLIQSSPRSFR